MVTELKSGGQGMAWMVEFMGLRMGLRGMLVALLVVVPVRHCQLDGAQQQRAAAPVAKADYLRATTALLRPSWFHPSAQAPVTMGLRN